MLASSRASVTARPAVLARRGVAAPRAVVAQARPVSIKAASAAADSSISRPKIAVPALRPVAAPVAARRAVVAQASSNGLEG